MVKSKRDDGRYQRNIIVGRKANGAYIRKTIYGKTKKELELKIAEITQQIWIIIKTMTNSLRYMAVNSWNSD